MSLVSMATASCEAGRADDTARLWLAGAKAAAEARRDVRIESFMVNTGASLVCAGEEVDVDERRLTHRADLVLLAPRA